MGAAVKGLFPQVEKAKECSRDIGKESPEKLLLMMQ